VRRALLWLSVGTNLGILAIFKYFNFFMDAAIALTALLKLPFDRPTLEIVLPIGISFYTFHELAYVVDVYRGEIAPVGEFWVYALYVLYFPQLVAGPIARPRLLLPQLLERRLVGAPLIQEGLALILIGYFKKVGVADVLAPLVNARFVHPDAWSSAGLLSGLYLFALQIYCDFSGYTDIARGVSKLFGIELLTNFKRPYFASSIGDFWHRWHISLSTWLRDYLYIPLGGSRLGTRRTYLNLLLTMLLGGLWHGANWTFVVWGGLHGLFLSLNRAWQGVKERYGFVGADASRLGRVAGAVLTFHLVAFAWIFFRSPSFGVAWSYISGLGTWHSWGHPATEMWPGARVVVLATGLLGIDVWQASAGEDFIARMAWGWQGVWYALLVAAILTLGTLGEKAPFIYFQF
jgi:D-alanyl-lipoteichoic acid acyltransferase DltB (MBOAT superfamily)